MTSHHFDRNPSRAERRRRRQRRVWRKRRRRIFCALLVLLLLGATAALLHWGLHRSYTAEQLGIDVIRSPYDADGDGVDDYTDMMLGARAYIQTDPHYKSKYYAGGYPDDGLGVCTDVIWHAFDAAGYQLKDLVDEDIANHPEAYPFIDSPDGNIDFRRVNTLDAFFRRHAKTLTNSLDDPQQWQAGDIVIFGQREHIGICSDRRDKNGIPFLIHHGNPVEDAVEQPAIPHKEVTGHFRWVH